MMMFRSYERRKPWKVGFADESDANLDSGFTFMAVLVIRCYPLECLHFARNIVCNLKKKHQWKFPGSDWIDQKIKYLAFLEVYKTFMPHRTNLFPWKWHNKMIKSFKAISGLQRLWSTCTRKTLTKDWNPKRFEVLETIDIQPVLMHLSFLRYNFYTGIVLFTSHDYSRTC